MRYEFIVLILILAGGIYILQKTLRKVTVFEFERGLKYTKGKYIKLLDAGEYWYNAHHTAITKVDIRPSYRTVPSQEVLSKDGVAVKLSLAANLEVVEPSVAVNSVNDFEEAFYLIVQLALRSVVGTIEIDKLLETRQDIGKEIFKIAEEEIEQLGLKLISIEIKDITFPGALKQTFSQVVKARYEGLAALERARGESAALRNLSNTAKILEKNPALMQLRTLQSFNESTGNTLVLNLSSESLTALKATDIENISTK